MKLFLFAISLVILISCSESKDELEDGTVAMYPVEICKPGLTFRQGCNHCYCNKFGTTKYCTQINCNKIGSVWQSLVNVFNNTNCEANKVYRVDCHKCTCDSLGKEINCPDENCTKKLFKLHLPSIGK